MTSSAAAVAVEPGAAAVEVEPSAAAVAVTGAHPISVVGVGPGHPDCVTPTALKEIQACDVIVGSERHLGTFAPPGRETVVVRGALEPLLDRLDEMSREKRVAVLVSGDPGMHSLLGAIRRRFPPGRVRVIPGLSSVQYLFAAIGESYEDARVVSCHGGIPTDLVDTVKSHHRVVILTDPERTPGRVAAILREGGVSGRGVVVGENLSYPDERIVRAPLDEFEESGRYRMSVMLVEEEPSPAGRWPAASARPPASVRPPASARPPASVRPPASAGPAASAWSGCWPEEWKRCWNGNPMAIPDSLFLRGDAPMTREDVRSLSIARLVIRPGDVVYDIGAGTGSVSVACALLAPAGRVYAFERDPAAARLIAENASRFGAANVEVVQCEAPPRPGGPRSACIESPDRVFVGGSGDRLDAILEWVDRNLKPGGRLVLNCVTIETLATGLAFMRGRGYAGVGGLMATICALRLLGGKHSYGGANPVYIIWGERGDRDAGADDGDGGRGDDRWGGRAGRCCDATRG